MAKQYKISIVGSGNVALHLALALENAGHIVQEVFSRNLAHAKIVSSKLYNALPLNNLDFSGSSSQVFFIAVNDDAIAEVVAKLKLPPSAFVAHTSGSTPITILSRFENYAVFYPLQTFSKAQKLDFKNIPICLEGSNSRSAELFKDIAKTISNSVQFLDSDKRKAVHLSAVFACNFTNHLLGIATYILQTQELHQSLLHPIIAETINKAMIHDPFSVQTGPASRNDQKIINEHMGMLEDIPEYSQVYNTISQSIIHQRSEEN